MASPLLLVPPEITEYALTYASPLDVAAFAQTCRAARAIVYGAPDQHLWRSLFLANFDDLRIALDWDNPPPKPANIDWQGELQHRVRAAALIRSHSLPAFDTRIHALAALVAVARSAPPVSGSNTTQHSSSLLWLSSVVRGIDAFSLSKSIAAGERFGLHQTPSRTELELQLLSQLRCYLGLAEDDKLGSLADAMRTQARCYVYNLSHYSSESCWGPFHRNGSSRVNWRHVEALSTVLAMNFRDLNNSWPLSRPPVGLEATRAYSASGLSDRPRNPLDWAGVEGTWRRFVCFMDYRDLFAFNYSTAFHGPYDPSFFARDDFQEAKRLIEMKLHITETPEVSCTACLPASTSPPRLRPAPSTRPDIHFSGTSRSGNGNEASVRGTVCMTPDGHVRWRFVSFHIGHHHWSAEGVQIGNVGSAAGVVGAWTGAHHDDGDPAGPFWLWKVDEDHPVYVDDNQW